MNAKPVAAIERIREWSRGNAWHFAPPRLEAETIVAWADSIPDGAVPVVWPADCTKQTLDGFADSMKANGHIGAANALRALAAIAPQRKKRVVNLWVTTDGTRYFRETYEGDYSANGWKCVARNVELED